MNQSSIMTKPRLILLLLIGLNQCTSPPPHLPSPPIYLRTHQQAIIQYLKQANQAPGPAANVFTIQAAEQALQASMVLWSQQLLHTVQLAELSAPSYASYHILQAHSALYQKEPKQALRWLAPLTLKSLAIEQQIAYLQIQAQALLTQSTRIAGIQSLITLRQLATTESQKKSLQLSILQQLSQISISELQAILATSSDADLISWATLVAILKQKQLVPRLMHQALRDWANHYPTHPLAQREREVLLPKARQQHIALLLPMSGPLAKPGQAIRDGFMEAYYQAPEAALALKVKVYDTHATPIKPLLSQLKTDKIDFIIGPLDKTNIQAFIRHHPGILTLFLNHTPHPLPHNSYQFSLDPKQETAQIAQKAWQEGRRRALLIAPSGPWGEQILQAFRYHWQLLGGQISEQLLYPNTEAVNQQLPILLHLQASQHRKNSLETTLNRPLIFYPRIRQDIDMIFLVALPSAARQIRPMLQYHFAGDLPIYSPSTVYNGIPLPQANKDLDEIIFCDMPTLLYGPSRLSSPIDSWPEHLNSHQRLQALGYDSFLIMLHLPFLQQGADLGLPGKSGYLQLNEQGIIQRALYWAQFKQGVATPF